MPPAPPPLAPTEATIRGGGRCGCACEEAIRTGGALEPSQASQVSLDAKALELILVTISAVGNGAERDCRAGARREEPMLAANFSAACSRRPVPLLLPKRRSFPAIPSPSNLPPSAAEFIPGTEIELPFAERSSSSESPSYSLRDASRAPSTACKETREVDERMKISRRARRSLGRRRPARYAPHAKTYHAPADEEEEAQPVRSGKDLREAQ